MKKPLHIAVLMGGPSVERDISLLTGENVVAALKAKGYTVTPLVLTTQNDLLLNKEAVPFPDTLQQFDIIFNALHGTFGEDGQLQKILEDLNIPYTGSDSKASQLGMDKWESRKVFQKQGLRVPKSEIFSNASHETAIYPFVLKPRASGSSDGVSIIRSHEDLHARTEFLYSRDDDMLMEEYLNGTEFTCGVLDYQGTTIALPVVEIRPKEGHEFFDYEAKYDPAAADEIVPAPISDELTREIQRIALHAHRLLGCRVYSRTDIILCNGELYVLEVNTLPAFTKNSLIPKAAAAHGIDFSELVETVLLSSLSHFQ